MKKGGQPILLNGQQAAWHTQQFSAAILLPVSVIVYTFLHVVSSFLEKKGNCTKIKRDFFEQTQVCVTGGVVYLRLMRI